MGEVWVERSAQQGSAGAVGQWEGRGRNTGGLILSAFYLSRCPGSAAPTGACAVPKALGDPDHRPLHLLSSSQDGRNNTFNKCIFKSHCIVTNYSNVF